MSSRAVHPEVARPWDSYLSAQDRELVKLAGYGGRVGWGRRAALLVVDMTYGFCGDKPGPILDVVGTRHNACGAAAWSAVAATADLLCAARESDVPVIYTRPAARERPWGSGRWEDKNCRTGETDVRAREIVADIRPMPNEAVLEKEGPSAFFGTPLVSWLTHLGVDTLIVCGGTTSGCVRATVVDAFSHNFRVLVAGEATFDRVEASHLIGLFDLDLKYADVEESASLAAQLRRCARNDAALHDSAGVGNASDERDGSGGPVPWNPGIGGAPDDA